MESRTWSLTNAFKKGWSLTKEYFIVLLGLLFLYGIVSLIMGLLPGTNMSSVRYWVFYLLQLVVLAWLGGGLCKVLLNAVDDEEPSFSVFKELIPVIPNLTILTLIISILALIPMAVVLGIQYCFVVIDWDLMHSNNIESLVWFYSSLIEGYWSLAWLVASLVSLYISIRLMFATLALVDRPAEGLVVALRRSWMMSRGNMGKLILFFLLVVLINIIGLCLFVIGLFVSIIVSMLAFAVIYRQIEKGMEDPKSIAEENNVCN